MIKFYCMIDHHNFKISNFIVEIFIGIMNPKPSVKESSPKYKYTFSNTDVCYYAL